MIKKERRAKTQLNEEQKRIIEDVWKERRAKALQRYSKELGKKKVILINELVLWFNRKLYGTFWFEIGENSSEGFIRKAPEKGLFFSVLEQSKKRR